MEIEGRGAPVTACTEPVSDGMVVHLNTPKVKRLRNTAFELLLTHHHLDCANCAKNRNCELQNTASRLGLKLKPKRLRRIPRNLPIDSSHTLFIYDPNKCVLCGRCVWICRERLGIGGLGFAHRGFERIVTTFGDEPIAESECSECSECVLACPTGALTFKE